MVRESSTRLSKIVYESILDNSWFGVVEVQLNDEKDGDELVVEEVELPYITT
jgi:hypothetical protein